MSDNSFLTLNHLIPHPLASSFLAVWIIVSIISCSLYIKDKLNLTRAGAICCSVFIYALIGLSAFCLSVVGRATPNMIMIPGIFVGCIGMYWWPKLFHASGMLIHNEGASCKTFWDKVHFCALAVLLLSLFLSSIAPPTDADSLDYHLGVPLEILRMNASLVRHDWLCSYIIGTGEYVNLVGLSIGTDCVSAVTSFFSCIGFLLLLPVGANSNQKRFLQKLVLTVPVYVFLVSSQKPQLVGTLGIVAGLSCLFESKSVKGSTFGVLALLCASSVKYSFYLPAFMILLFGLILAWKRGHAKQYIFVCVVGYLGILFPLHLHNYVVYGDPLAPLFSNLFGVEHATYVTGLKSMLEGYSPGFPFPISLVVPNTPGGVTTVLGAGVFAFLWVPFSERKPIVLVGLALFISLSILLFGQSTSRFFLDPYLIVVLALGMCATVRPYWVWLSRILTIQLFVATLFALMGVVTLTKGSLTWSLRDDVMRKHAYGYAFMSELDKTLPENSFIINSHRSHALIPRPFLAQDIYKMQSQAIPLWNKYILRIPSGVKVFVTHASPVYSNERLQEYVTQTNLVARGIPRGVRNPFNHGTHDLYVSEINIEKLKKDILQKLETIAPYDSGE